MHSRKNFPVLFSFTTYYRLCNYITTTGATSGAGTAYPAGAPEFTPGFSGVRVTRSLVLYVYFVDRCLSFFFWPLCCLFFFDMQILIAPLVYSNSANENSTSFRKAVWLYNQGNYPIFRGLISNTNWKSTVSEQPNVYIAYELLTGKFLKIADECIRPNTVIIRRNDKIWMTYEIRRTLRVGDR
jgi:hypothetical protein